jgi:hypothetical protein
MCVNIIVGVLLAVILHFLSIFLFIIFSFIDFLNKLFHHLRDRTVQIVLQIYFVLCTEVRRIDVAHKCWEIGSCTWI